MKSRRLFIALALTLAGLVLALALPQVARADGPIYVDRDAPGPVHDGLSWTTAYTDVQGGLDAAIPGDELWVAEGVYTPTYQTDAGDARTATFILTDTVALYGGFGGYGIGETLRSQRDWNAHVTVLSGDLDGNDITDANGVVTDTANINGNNAYHVVTGSGTDGTAVLDGFTVTGGDGSNGGGMYNDYGHPTLINVTFSGNHAGWGGGMSNDDSAPTLINVTFSGNHAYGGGGMYNDDSAPTLINVTFSGNHAYYGGGMSNSSSHPTLINVTFSGNHANDGSGGGMHNTDSNPTLSNCILWGNAPPQIVGSATVNYSLVEGGYSGTGNLDADPQFVDFDGTDNITGTLDDNLRLLPASPAVDAGDNTAVPTDTLDLDGDGVVTEPLPFDLDSAPRFVDVPFRPDAGNGTPPIVDMGACEANPRDLWIAKAVLPTTPRTPGDAITYTLAFANGAAAVATDVVITDVVPAQVTGLGVISSGVAITPITGLTYAWTVQNLAPGAGGIITLTGVISPGLAAVLDFVNTVAITTTAVDTDTTNNMSSVWTHVSGIIYVDADAPGMADGSSWTDAFTDVQDALALAVPGDELWVAEGVYTPTNVSGREATFQLVSGVPLYGGFGGYGIGETLRSQRDWEAYVTVLSGDLDGNDVADLNGVVTDTANITGTNAYHVVTGSGTDGTAVLDGFTVTGGQANYDGGGMYNDYGHPTLINVIFSGNYADLTGSGMYNGGSNPTLSNVTFSSNHANGSGGGMYNGGSNPTLINVTFSGNHAGWRGGGMDNSYSSSPTLINVTFSGNQANGPYSGGGGMSNYESDPTLINVTFSGNHAYGGGGMYNTDSNPTLSNCILWGNTASHDPQIDGSATVNYSLVQGGYSSGTGNLDADPQFVDFDGTDNITGTLDDNLRLLPTSPAVDAGDNTAVPADTLDLDGDGVTAEPLPFDLDGNPRFVDMPLRPDTGNGTPPIVDMGAYETAPPTPDLTVTKRATPDPVQPGDQLTYTIHITNTGDIDLHATITDTLPISVTLGGTSGGTLVPPGGTVILPNGRMAVTWTAVITEPGGLWMGTIVVTVDEDQEGPLTNVVEVTTKEGAVGQAIAIVNARKVYLPLVLRNF